MWRAESAPAESRSFAARPLTIVHTMGKIDLEAIASCELGNVRFNLSDRCGWQTERDILQHAERIEQRELLEHHRNAKRAGASRAIDNDNRSIDCNRPRVGRVTPYTIFINVLLPAPFSPSSATISPGITSNETASLAIVVG